jgi:HlyD family secretion protein
MNGVVSALNVQKGTIISSAISNVGGGTTVITLSDLSRIFVLATVDESSIGQVKVGQDATITVDAFRGQAFSGKVIRIAAKGVNVSNVVTFEVKIEVTSQNKAMLKPLMTANVQIIQERHDEVLLVPVRAVQRQDNQIVAVVVNADDTTSTRAVTVGMMDGENYEVLSGLQEGERVQLARSDADQSRWRGRGPNIFGGAGGASGGRGGGGGGGGGGRGR